MGCCQSDEKKEKHGHGGRSGTHHHRYRDKSHSRSPREEPPEDPAEPEDFYAALWTYAPSCSSEVALEKRDRVILLQKESDGFLFVRTLQKNVMRGYVQEDYLKYFAQSPRKPFDLGGDPGPPPTRRELPTELRDRWREIPRHEMNMTRKLGEGRFGEVHMATWTQSDGTTLTVVVKSLKKLTAKDKDALLNEAATMKDFRHPNVVRLYGVVSASEPNLLVSEFIKNGSLDDYLKKRSNNEMVPLSTDSLIDISGQVCRGMEYLHMKKIVHRDLAARNVLIDVKSESPFKCVVKVADFGLARTMNKDYVYRMKHDTYLAVKWLAPEGFKDTVFSKETDVWAFGVTLGEIFNGGEDPWNGDMDEADVVKRITAGYGPEKPPAMPSSVYDVMCRCCQKHSKNRPTFAALVKDFERLRK